MFLSFILISVAILALGAGAVWGYLRGGMLAIFGSATLWLVVGVGEDKDTVVIALTMMVIGACLLMMGGPDDH